MPRLLPTSLNLPAITATEYCVNYVHQLRSVLAQCPPNQPTEMAIDMLVAVAQLQRCVWLLACSRGERCLPNSNHSTAPSCDLAASGEDQCDQGPCFSLTLL